MIYGYIRVSTDKQNIDSQKLAIHQWASAERLHIDHFIEVTISSRKTLEARRIDDLMVAIQSGDSLVVTELSRLGRSLLQVITIVNALKDKGVSLHILKENIHTNENNLDTTIKLGLFAILGEVERELLVQRTKEGLAAARARGVTLGAPKGQTRASKLDAHTAEIVRLLKDRVPHTVIAERYSASRGGLAKWITRRNIQQLVAQAG